MSFLCAMVWQLQILWPMLRGIWCQTELHLADAISCILFHFYGVLH